ncbi:MAG: YggT family protein [Candidatus Cloacimonetes bacterium]|nr:YggT family protein [Candidatus Cloacimonadota bacterium]
MIYSGSITGTAMYLLVRVIQIYTYLLFARVLMSWIIRNPANPIYHFLYELTEPVLAPIRRIMPSMGLDLSPIIAYMILNLLARLIASLI